MTNHSGPCALRRLQQAALGCTAMQAHINSSGSSYMHARCRGKRLPRGCTAIQHLHVYAISDVHVDHAENMAWIHGLTARQFQQPNTRSLLLLAGDVSDNVALLRCVTLALKTNPRLPLRTWQRSANSVVATRMPASPCCREVLLLVRQDQACSDNSAVPGVGHPPRPLQGGPAGCGASVLLAPPGTP